MDLRSKGDENEYGVWCVLECDAVWEAVFRWYVLPPSSRTQLCFTFGVRGK
jgi:hypothetical protein